MRTPSQKVKLVVGVGLGALSAGLLAASSATAAAADTAPSSQALAGAAPTLQEVVVTAEKRSERLLDVPMSITTATGRQLQDAGVANVADLQKIAPGFTYQPSNTGTPVYSIRGVGFFSNTASVSPTVGVYVDQVPLPFSVMAAGVGLDLERVEVLKGPQGTLFGENSTGGAINYIANKPTRQFEAGGQVSYGRFDDVNADGYVSGPLTDTLAGRLAVGTEQRGAWQQSESRPGDTLGRRNFTNGRLVLDWKPTDKVRFEFGLNGWRDRSDTQAGQFLAFTPARPSPPGYADLFPGLQAYEAAHTPAPNDARAADWVPHQNFRNDDNFYQISLRADWDLSDAVTLTSITSYAGLRRKDPQTIGGSNLPDLDILTANSIHTVAQELRLSGHADGGALRWMIGGNYEGDVAKENQSGFDFYASNSGVGPFRYHSFGVQNDQDIETSAIFGSLDYKVSPTLTLQGSARYTQSNNAFHGCARDTGDGAISNAFTFLDQIILGNHGAVNPGPGACVSINPATATFVPIVKDNLDQSNVSWRVGVNWKPESETLLYVNITKGYKAGAYNTIPAVYTTQFRPVTQEAILAYEGGFKQEFRSLGLQLSGAGFYYDYSDKQLLGVVPVPIFGALPGLVTVPKSAVTGGELALNWRPLRGLSINVAGTYVASHVDGKFLTSDPFGNMIDINGEAFPNTPKWQLTSDARYEFPIGERLTGFVGGGVQYLSSRYATLGDLPTFKLEGHALLDLRAGVSNGQWRAEIWGKNVTNTFYATTVEHFADTLARLNGMPATYGITLAYSYK